MSAFTFAVDDTPSDETAGGGGKGDYQIFVAQKEEISEDVPAILVNVPATYTTLLRWLKGGQCFLLHYGGEDPDAISTAIICATIRSKEKVGVQYFSKHLPNAPGKTKLIGYDEICPAFYRGDSIIYHVQAPSDFVEVGRMIAKITDNYSRQKGPHRVDFSTARMGILIDRSGSYAITHRIIDPNLDESFFTGASRDASRVSEGIGIEACYLPQGYPTDIPRPNSLCKIWETKAKAHQFRNAIYPSFAEKKTITPLSELFTLISHSPFQKGGVICIALLASRGAEFKSLMDYWITQCFGSITHWVDIF